MYIRKSFRFGVPCSRDGWYSSLAGACTILVLVLAGADTSAQQPATVSGRSMASSSALAFTEVTVIDVTNGRLLPGQVVLIVGNKIQAVGSAGEVPVPQGATVVDAQGKYLIPGLWDMHAHVDQFYADWYPRFIAYGVTGVRELGQRSNGPRMVALTPDSFRIWQRQIMDGTRVGPRVPGPSADLHPWGDSPRYSPESARRLVDSSKALGLTFLKFHSNGSDRESYFTLLREARQGEMPIIGHIPEKVTEVEAADSGHRSVEHAIQNRQCWAAMEMLQDSASPATPVSVLEKPCVAAAAAYIRNDTWIVPTVHVYYRVKGRTPDFLPARRLAIVRRMVQTMRRAGFKAFLAGTDVNNRRALPGFSVLQEVVLLERSGLTPLEALQSATIGPAQFFHATDSLGTVAPGKLADLVLLDANPLADITNVMQIRAVVANGRYFDRATLDTLDPQASEARQLTQAFIAQQSGGATATDPDGP